MVKDHTTFISLKSFNMNAFPLYVNMADPYEGVETEVLGTKKTLKERKERRVRLYFMRCETNVYLANLCGPLGYVLAVAFHTIRQVPNVAALVAMISRMVLTLIPEGEFFARQGFEAALKAALPKPWKIWTKDVAATVTQDGGSNFADRPLLLNISRVSALIVAWQEDPTLEVVIPSLDHISETFGSNHKHKRNSDPLVERLSKRLKSPFC